MAGIHDGTLLVVDYQDSLFFIIISYRNRDLETGEDNKSGSIDLSIKCNDCHLTIISLINSYVTIAGQNENGRR
jgi:hypothetical protein